MIGLLLSANWKGNNYALILVIINLFTKIVYYKPVKLIINNSELIEEIIDIIVQYYGLSNFIINNHRAIFTSKF